MLHLKDKTLAFPSVAVVGIGGAGCNMVQCKALYLLAGQGRAGGSTATPALVRLAHDAGLHTVAMVGMPAHREGAGRHTVAERALESVQEYAAETVVVHGDAVAELLGENGSVGSFMAEVDDRLLREWAARVAATARQR